MTLEEFFVLLKTSHLLRPEQFALLRGDIARLGPNITADHVANRLVQQNLLTPWQSEQLLVHGWNGFRVGNYTLTEQIGKGGMGAVFKAEHSVMGRTVSFKVLSKTRLDNPSAVARFRREVKAAAALDHPNIIVAHDAGQVGDVHYLVMEYVEGRDLNAWLMEYGVLPVPWACEFIRQAALGLEHAWQRGMVHRDIKPANLVVLWNDRDKPPVVKILDMGLARFTQELVDELDEADRKLKNRFDSADGHLTQVGQILGTPDYLAPEQIEGTHTVDIRADIFSLGCTLFKLLTGVLPFGGENVMEKLQARIDRSAAPAPLLSSFRSEIPPRLDQIMARMLERDQNKRYQQPGEVAHDLSLLGFEQHWTREPPTVAAGSNSTHEASSIALEAPAQLLPSPSYRPGAFVEDADSGTRAFLSHLARQVTAEYGDSTEDFGESMLPPLVTGGPSPAMDAVNAPEPPFAAPVSRQPPAAAGENPHAVRRRQLRRRQSAMAMVVAGVATVVVGIGLMYVLSAALDRIRNSPVTDIPIPLDEPGGPDGSGYPPPDGSTLHVLKGHAKGVMSVAISARRIASGDMNGQIKVWNQRTGTLEKTFSGHEYWVTSLAMTPSGSLLASGGQDTSVRLWSPDDSREISLAGHEATVDKMVYSRDGSQLLTGDVDGNVKLWVDGRDQDIERTSGGLLALGFAGNEESSGQHAVALYTQSDQLVFWNLTLGQAMFPIDLQRPVSAACFSPGGRYLACATSNGMIHVVNVKTRNRIQFKAHEDWIHSLAISADGNLVASGGNDGSVHVQHVAQSKGNRFLGHTGPVQAVALSADGRVVVSGSKDTTVRLWYVSTAEVDP